MWDFIKSAPWTFAIVALVFVVALVGVIVAVVLKGRWTDQGFMTTDDGKNKLMWSKGDLPIVALAHPDLPLTWRATYLAAASRMNSAIKAKVFDQVTQDLPPGYNIDGPIPPGFILLWPKEPAGELQVDHGRTTVNWRRDDGRIYSALVEVPRDGVAQRASVMLHELGHVLGLAHDDGNLGSIMYPKLGGRIAPGEVTVADADRLRKVYG